MSVRHVEACLCGWTVHTVIWMHGKTMMNQELERDASFYNLIVFGLEWNVTMSSSDLFARKVRTTVHLRTCTSMNRFHALHVHVDGHVHVSVL